MRTISDYQIIEKLFESSKSAVYRAQQKGNDEQVILKMLPEQYPTADRIARLKQEFELIRSLDGEP